MDNKPLLSIITVCFNDLEGLTKTEKSILSSGNDKLPIEWIVIDGNSTDGTRDFLKNSKSLSKYISERDNGIYDAMNKGTALATGKYLIYMNSGDIFLDLKAILQEIIKEGRDLLFFDALFNYGKYSRVRPARKFSYIYHGIPANHQAIVFRREALGLSPYDTTYKICGDYKLLADLYKKNHSCAVINKVTAEFSVGGTSTKRGIKLLNEAYTIQRSTLGMSRRSALLSYIKRSMAILTTLALYKINHA